MNFTYLIKITFSNFVVLSHFYELSKQTIKAEGYKALVIIGGTYTAKEVFVLSVHSFTFTKLMVCLNLNTKLMFNRLITLIDVFLKANVGIYFKLNNVKG